MYMDITHLIPNEYSKEFSVEILFLNIFVR